MTYNFLAGSIENTEKAMLFSLIVVLGIILYMKLIKNLKRKRLSESFSSIDGYDIVQGELIIRYTVPSAVESNFVFNKENGSLESSFPINHSTSGSFEFKTSVNQFSDKLVVLNFSTDRLKITKKIRLDIGT